MLDERVIEILTVACSVAGLYVCWALTQAARRMRSRDARHQARRRLWSERR